MHERQAAVVLGLLLILPVIFANDSFGEKYQSNVHGDNDKDKKDKKGGEDSNKYKDWKKENDRHDDDDDNDLDKHHSIQDLQKQIMDLQNQIRDIVLGIIYWNDIQEIPEDIADGDADTLSELDCVDGEIPKKQGEEWKCSVDQNDAADVNKASSAIFFHFGFVGKGQIEWVGTSTQTYDSGKIDEASLVMPTSGTLSNLFAKTGTLANAQSPGIGESYKLTLLVNGLETTPSLSCIIADAEETCSDKSNEIFVNEGDALVLKIEASQKAPFAYISSSVLLT